jgi:Fur family ferric uptake transcriptional regulator
MINNKHLEKINFRTLIENDSIGRMEDRLNIIDVFLDTEEHVTLEDMIQLLKEAGYDYDPEFIRQCLNRFVEHGFAQKKTFEGQSPRYEHRHLGKHHDHFICTKCNQIIEFDNDEMERLQLKIASDHGFHMLQHKMEIYGVCAKGMEKRSPLMPLAMAKPGEKVVIKDMTGGEHVRTRLASMGLRSGDTLEIINNNGLGRLIVGHGPTRLALGRGVAQKIMVSLAKQPVNGER